MPSAGTVEHIAALANIKESSSISAAQPRLMPVLWVVMKKSPIISCDCTWTHGSWGWNVGNWFEIDMIVIADYYNLTKYEFWYQL